ncbi:MAG: hypothetical protein ACO1OG_08310 [Devosia sp.]
MKTLTAASLTAVLLAFAVQPAQATDDGSRYVSYQTLVDHCSTRLDSRGEVSLKGRDGAQVRGFVDCETDYDFRVRQSDGRWGDDDDGRRYVTYATLVEFCATKAPNSRAEATLTGRNGDKVTGLVDCDTDYDFDLPRTRQAYSDDDRWDNDDRWDDDDHYDDNGGRRGDDDRWDD